MRRPSGRAGLAPCVENHLGRVGEILEVHLLHLLPERLVFDHRVELAIAEPARDVQVGRADTRPARVGHCGLRMQHCSVPLEHAHARFDQRTVARARKWLHEHHVGRVGHQQSHVDAVLGRRAQALDVRGRSGVVRVGQPQPLSCKRGDQLVEAEHASGSRGARDDAQCGISRRRDRIHDALLGGKRRSGQRPDLGERGFNLGDCRPADLDAGVAPRLDVLFRNALPSPADAHARDEADRAVDREHLAMVARQPRER